MPQRRTALSVPQPAEFDCIPYISTIKLQYVFKIPHHPPPGLHPRGRYGMIEGKKERGRTMQRWSPEVIRYLHTAADRSRYYTDLARELGAFLHPEDRVCDAGCGLGLLSRALLPYCGHVTAIDRSPAAIADLTARGHDPRLTVLTGDIRDLPPQKPYDAMVFCLFGGTEEILDIAARQCGGTALVVRRDFRQHQFSTGVRMAGHTAADMEQELRRRGLTCTLRRFTLEFGQPFRSVEDALAFFRLYSRDGTVPPRQELEARLQPSPWPDYPLYLPNPKPLCLLAIPAAQLKEDSHG